MSVAAEDSSQRPAKANAQQTRLVGIRQRPPAINKRQRGNEPFTGLSLLLSLLLLLMQECGECDGGLCGEEEMNVAELYSNGN